jgi:hypothetical protein
MERKLKIIHCANFSYPKNGEVFYATDMKVTHGLIQNGHMVYDFSYRDQAKLHRFLGFKKTSIKLMNKDLISTCQNIKPDVLMLAKSELITVETLKTIKKLFPEIKIAQWFVDFLDYEKKDFFEKLNYIDTFFQTSAAKLEKLSETYPQTFFSYMPNIADPAFEHNLNLEKKYDIIYVARDYKEDNRYKFAVLLKAFCEQHHLNLKLFASLGQPPIFGQAYYEAIAQAKIAINFNRTDHVDGINEKKFMGSSDRMNHMMGTGTCLFSPKILGLDMLYKDGEDLVYFEGFDDCGEKLLHCLKSREYERIARQGQKKVFEISNAKKVTKYMLETLYADTYSEHYEWETLKYYQGRQTCLES